MQAILSKETLKTILITAIFDTLIAAVIYNMVLTEQNFFDVFVISQCMGLSICFCITAGTGSDMTLKTKRSAAGIMGGLAAGIFLGSVLAFGYLFLVYRINPGYFFKNAFSYVFIFGLVFGVPIIYFFSSRERIIESEKLVAQEKIKRLTIEKEAAMTSLRLLQAQIEPHFLFNTLSNIISLFDINVEKARQMLADLNEYLRISLQRTRQEMITLSEELDLVRQYLDIFKIRMGERLTYEIRDRTGIPDLPFVPLIIQPLVENSIKYGIEPKTAGGKITIDCFIEENMLEIHIKDTGRGLDEDANQAGIGINNVSRRLEYIYGEKAGLSLTENHPSGISARIRIPL